MLSNSTGLSAALKRHSNRCNAAYIHPTPAAQRDRDRSETEAGFSFTITLLCDVWMTSFYIIICFLAFASPTYDSTGGHHPSTYRKLPALPTDAAVCNYAGCMCADEKERKYENKFRAQNKE